MESPNSTVSKIRKFIMADKVPEGASRLLLHVAQASGGEPMQMMEWTLAQAQPVVAQDAVVIVDDYVAEMEHEALAVLTWQAEDGKVLGRLPFKRRKSQSLDAGMEAPSEALKNLTGDANSLVKQMQCHLEAMMRIHTAGIGGLMQQMMATCDHAMSMCETMASKLAQAEHEAVMAKRERDEAIGVAQEIEAAAAGSVVEQKQSEIVKMLQPVLGQIIMQAMSANAGPSGPVNPPPAQ